MLLQQLAPLDRAGPDALSFLVTPRYCTDFRSTRAGAVLLAESLAGEPGGPGTRIIVAEPDRALRLVAEAFSPPPPPLRGIAASAEVAAGVALGEGVGIGPQVVVEAGVRIGARTQVGAGTWLGEGVVIGDDCEIGPRVVCYPGARLGSRVVLKAGAVIGGPGFGFLRGGEGHRRVPHLGGCILEDDVEVGSASCVDRGSFDDTVIGQGTKLDNLVQVGHNVRIGRRCLIAATTGIAGSCQIGDDVIIAGGVGIADHVTIGSGAVVGAKSVVFGPGLIEAGAVVSGYPARPHRAFLRAQAALYRLAPLAGELEALVTEGEAGAAPDRRTRR